MPVNQDQLDRFHQFALQRIRQGEADTMEELVSDWAGLEISQEQLQRNATAIQQAVDDMEAGDAGRPARDVVREFRTKHGLSQG